MCCAQREGLDPSAKRQPPFFTFTTRTSNTQHTQFVNVLSLLGGGLDSAVPSLSSGASVFTSRKSRIAERGAMSPVLNALQNLQHLLLLSPRLAAAAAFRHEPTNFDPRFTTVLYSSTPL
uniref:(northern house mosquito) hypothetical protein n=1 Tax=Culex pipiens TaxID=7175 RepID=A0A8D8J9W9_CULPI